MDKKTEVQTGEVTGPGSHTKQELNSGLCVSESMPFPKGHILPHSSAHPI